MNIESQETSLNLAVQLTQSDRTQPPFKETATCKIKSSLAEMPLIFDQENNDPPCIIRLPHGNGI